MKGIVKKVVKVIKELTKEQLTAATAKIKKNGLKTKLTEHLDLKDVARLFMDHGKVELNLSQLMSSKLKEKCMEYFALKIDYKLVIVLIAEYAKEHKIILKLSDKVIYNYEKEYKAIYLF